MIIKQLHLIQTYLIIFQAFVSEYALTREEAGNGTLLAAVAEAGFLIGLERNRFSQT